MKLLLGDCLEILPTLSDNSVDMLLVDLPYGTTACKWDSIIPLDKLWEQYNRICKQNAAMVFTAAQPFTTVLASSNIKNFKYEWIWEKPQGTNPMNSKVMPLKSHENILVFYRKKPTYNPQMWYSTPYTGFVSDKSKGDGYYSQPDGVHTVAYQVNSTMTGSIKMQGSLATTPTDDDYFDITGTTFTTDQSTTISTANFLSDSSYSGKVAIISVKKSFITFKNSGGIVEFSLFTLDIIYLN